MKQTLVALVGPTANGKSAIGVEIARRIGGEIVSCDSMQVYRRMPVCTQAPPKNAGGVRHHLVSFVEPSREYSAARFRRDAEAAIRAIVRRGHAPVLVGGTGLYLRALLDGLFEAGAGRGQDEIFRKKLRGQAKKTGPQALHEQLGAIDPETASKIHPNDLRRVIRALEVHHLTGRPMSELKPRRAGLRGVFDCRVFLVERDRAELYRRIDKRVDRMMRAGLAAEAARLSKKRLSRTAEMALGLREMKRCLAGELTRAQAVELLKKNTRHYAKRQLSWFRHEKSVEVVPVGEKDSAATIAGNIIALLHNSPHAPLFKQRGGMSKDEKRPPSLLKEGGTGGVER